MTFVHKSLAALMISAAFAAPAMAQDLEFVLENQSGFTLMEFYTSPADVDSWEEDVLGADVLESGSAITIMIADGRTQCIYDMQMVFEDGDVLEDTVDMCEMGSYTIQ